jgi:signal peptidase I
MRQLRSWNQSLWQNKPWRWSVTVLFAALVGIAAGHTVKGTFSGSVSVVDGVSMAPTYKPGARIYTAPISSPLERGDIVLVDDGNQDKEYALKRIVGLPGETVQLWRGYIFINGRMLREPYLPKHTYTFPGERIEHFLAKIGPDQYFLLGDNRSLSVDSRSYGAVDRKQIKSRVPSSAGVLRPQMASYTLPLTGKRSIRPL